MLTPDTRLIIISILRVVYLSRALESAYPFFDGVDAAITTQVLLHYSLMAATIPCLKPFVVSFNSGWGQGLISPKTYYYYKKRSTATAGNNNNESTDAPSSPKPSEPLQGTLDTAYLGSQGQHQADVSSGGDTSAYANGLDAADSIHSSDSRRMMIRQTQGWSVAHEGYEMDRLR